MTHSPAHITFGLFSRQPPPSSGSCQPRDRLQSVIFIARMSDSPLRALSSSGGKDEVDRPIVALKFKLAKHQRTVGVAARLPRQREGMEDKVVVGVLLWSCSLA